MVAIAKRERERVGERRESSFSFVGGSHTVGIAIADSNRT